MKAAIIGYGKMGHEIHRILSLRGHDAALVVDADNAGDLCPERLAGVDVAIEFTTPSTAYDNVAGCIECGVPVVCGTTAWTDKMPQVRHLCEKYDGGFFYASNFSIGVNIMFRVNRLLARLMNGFADYDATVEETHHTQKKDAPSGTAVTLAEDMVRELERKDKWVCGLPAGKNELEVAAVRRSVAPGMHTVTYESEADILSLTHTAKNRSGFALGAVMAAEFMCGRKGVYTMDDLLEL